jgi:uncharacterized protein YjgD (DUF1641 family)
MDDASLQGQIDEINRKLDVILGEIELQRRHRASMEELKQDLIGIGRDVFRSTVGELEEVSGTLETGDILNLVKKLLRNVGNISAMFETLEAMKGLMEDISPISREMFLDLLRKLDEFDRKGYFAFLREFGTVIDRIVTSFSPEDVRNLGDNVVTILNTVKNVTQPETLQALNNALAVYKKLDIEIAEEITYMRLLKEMNSPEVRRGIAFAIRFLKSLAEHDHEGAARTNQLTDHRTMERDPQ